MTAMQIERAPLPSPGGGIPASEVEAHEAVDLEAVTASWLLGHRGRRTRVEYGRDVRRWVHWCDRMGVAPLEARRRHVDAWVTAELAEGASPASVRRYLSAVRGWYDHLVHDWEVLARNPAERVIPPKVPEPLQLSKLTAADVRGVIAQAAAEDEQTPGRHCELAVRLLAVQGLRVEEATELRCSDIGEMQGVMIAMIRGKGDKTRVAVLTGRTAELVRRRLAAPWVRTSHLREELLIPHAKRTLQTKVPAWGQAAGASRRVNCHELRHAAITLLLHEGHVDLVDVQAYAGHSNPATTISYDRDAGAIDRNPSRVLEAMLNEEDTP